MAQEGWGTLILRLNLQGPIAAMIFVLVTHSVSFSHIHSGGDDDDACLIRMVDFAELTSHETFFCTFYAKMSLLE